MSRLLVVPLLAASLAILTGCDKEQPTAASTQPALEEHDVALLNLGLGRSLPFLSRDQRRLFERGQVVFATFFSPEAGVGPLFNTRACAECHEDPIPGGVGDEVETHATAFQGGVCNDLGAVGGPVIQDSVTPALFAALGIDKEPVPLEATAIGLRTTPLTFGMGLLDAVSDGVLLTLADPTDINHDGISGRPNRTADGRLGRFGRKAQVATLREFVAGAFINEMGITSPAEMVEQTVHGNPLPPGVDLAGDPEITQDDLDATDAFMRFLAPPTPELRWFARSEGRRLFSRIQCSGCHIPALFTGRDNVRVLRFRAVFAYTDLLLHDMGQDLADICLGEAEPSEFRTEPLMGIRLKETFLHDGRATTIEDAIVAHGGEATGARDRFLELSPRQRAALLRFVGSL
jgi:CxxC motif-containing protein (DUF1111 family)